MKDFFDKYGNVIVKGIVKNLKWIIPTAAVAGVSIYGISTYADHDAMEHGYERKMKIGPVETGVKKLPGNTSKTIE